MRAEFKPLRFLLALALISGLSLAGWLISRQSKNYNTISDSSIGLTFNISKEFEAIPRDELTALNPGFIYGFRPPANKNTVCIISQSSLKGGGTTSALDLRDGILKEVKKIHPTVKLTNRVSALNLAKFGDAKGVLLEMEYVDKLVTFKRIEIIALGKANQVIAYCQSPAQDNPKYHQDFTTFFSSLKITG